MTNLFFPTPFITSTCLQQELGCCQHVKATYIEAQLFALGLSHVTIWRDSKRKIDKENREGSLILP